MRDRSAGAAWQPKLVQCLRDYSTATLAADVVAGVTVGLVALPLAMAFAIASGVAPQSGIYCAIVAGFLISALGGSRTQIGGPTGAFVVVVAGIVAGAVFDLAPRGVSLVGAVPQGLPVPGLPELSRADIRDTLPVGLACFLLAIVETVRIGDPFVAGNAARLRGIAWAVLGLELLHLGVGAVAAAVSTGAASLDVGWSFSVTRWLAVLLLFVLAVVFEQGTRMRADLEGTV